MSLLEISSLYKQFADTLALDNVSLAIEEGEFVCLLGRNGSGKSTLLKILAGVESSYHGSIRYAGQALTPDSLAQKELVMVWQSLALFPHMNVADNVAFGLSVRKVERTLRAGKVDEVLAKVGLKGYGQRRIHELSGGEQQRVALARALVLSPKVLLLDEPFGAIDVQLRSQLQALLREIHRREGLTIVMVTHDIPEALALAEKIVVMDGGKVRQTGTADELLHRPKSAVVARFMGNNNVLPGTVAGLRKDLVRVSTACGELTCKPAAWSDTPLEVGQEIAYLIDAADVSVGTGRDNQIKVAFESRVTIGALTVIRAVAPDFTNLRCEIPSKVAIVPNNCQEIKFSWNTHHAFALPLEETLPSISSVPTQTVATVPDISVTILETNPYTVASQPQRHVG